MRRSHIVLRALGLMLVSALVSCAGSPSGPGRVSDSFTVGQGGFSSIQAALNAAPSGATITVSAGVYGERLVVSKPVKLQGSGTVLDGLANGLDGRFVGIQVSSNDVQIRNNRIHGNGRAGIAVYGQHNIVIGNDASGNGSMNRAPSCSLDLVDYYGLDNEWSGNIGTFATDVVGNRLTCP